MSASRFCLRWFLLLTASASAFGHAPPIYVPSPPLQVRGASIIDRSGATVLLRGVAYDVLELENPNPISFRLIRQRWNANTVRITLSTARWLEQRDSYLDKATAAVQAARNERLIVVLGLRGVTPLPGANELQLWAAVAARFRDDDGVVFSLFDKPDASQVPGAEQGVRRPADWQFWRNGGGSGFAGMQQLADAIRNAGASSQLIAAPAFHDALGFQGFRPEHDLAGPNIIYEVHPSYAHESTDAQRQTNFGFLARRVPVYAGMWGMPFGRDSSECRALPSDPAELTLLLLQTLVWFDEANISWTAGDFAVGSMLRDLDAFTPADLPSQTAPPCNGETPTVGIGSTLLLWTTGDALGFGSILPELTASLAGGSAPSSLAPGQLVAFYGQGLGPSTGVSASLDAANGIPEELGGVRVYFNSIPAPVLYADSFQVYVQVPYEVAASPAVEAQLYWNDVPSNRIRFGVVAASPEPFTRPGGSSEALASNEDGRINSAANPAARGSVVVLSATGSGQTIPPTITGTAGQGGLPVLASSVTVGQLPAEVLFWRSSATEVGRQEIAIRIPSDLPVSTGSAAQRFALVLQVGTFTSRPGVVLWVR